MRLSKLNTQVIERAAHQRQNASVWKPLLQPLTEIHTPDMYTHYVPFSASFSRIDRIYTSAPSWLLTLVSPHALIHSSPDALHSKNISDHAPIGLHITSHKTQQTEEQAISPTVFQHVMYDKIYNNMLEKAKLDDIMHPPARALHHKAVIRAAAKKTLIYLRKDPTSSEEVPEWNALAYTTAARAFISQSHRFLYMLIQRHSFLQPYFVCTGTTSSLTDPDGFAAAHAAARTAAHRDRTLRLEQQLPSSSSVARGKLKGQITALSHATKLWSPFNSRLVLNGITTNETTVTTPAGIATALADAWRPVFANPPKVDVVEAKKYLEEHAVPLDFTRFKVPSTETFDNLLSKIQHSAPGPDGIPYAAWQKSGAAGRRTLSLLLNHSLSGRPLHPSFNNSITAFLPKGEEAADTNTEVHRKATDTRPLSLKNIDCKLITSSINYNSKHILTQGISKVQRGFVAKRQLLENVVDLDVFSHAFALAAHPSQVPVLVLFDFAAAFPSVAHSYLFLTLTAMHFPIGYINHVKNLYSNNHAYYKQDGNSTFIFIIVTGILQGCPLSGLLFAVAIDPFLRHLQSVAEQHKHTHTTLRCTCTTHMLRQSTWRHSHMNIWTIIAHFTLLP